MEMAATPHEIPVSQFEDAAAGTCDREEDLGELQSFKTKVKLLSLLLSSRLSRSFGRPVGRSQRLRSRPQRTCTPRVVH